MKKILLMFFALTGLLLFASCSKDKDTDKATLAGTSWTVTYNDGSDIITETITFTSDTDCVWVYADSYGYGDSSSGTYSYTPPTVVITVDGNVAAATVQGNTMEVDGYFFNKL